MDNFLTGLGMGNFSFLSSGSKQEAPKEQSRNPLEDLNVVDEPKPDTTSSHPKGPGKVGSH
jgi:hypothetical protein